MRLIYYRSRAPECKSGIQGLAIIQLKPVPRFVDVWGVKYMLIKLKLYVQMDIYRGKMIKIFFYENCFYYYGRAELGVGCVREWGPCAILILSCLIH